jgi:hypothetical protein
VLTRNIEKIHCFVVEFLCELLCLPYFQANFSRWDDAVDYYSKAKTVTKYISSPLLFNPGKMQMPDSYSTSLREDFLLAEISFMELLSSVTHSAFIFKFNCNKYRISVRQIRPDQDHSNCHRLRFDRCGSYGSKHKFIHKFLKQIPGIGTNNSTKSR